MVWAINDGSRTAEQLFHVVNNVLQDRARRPRGVQDGQHATQALGDLLASFLRLTRGLETGISLPQRLLGALECGDVGGPGRHRLPPPVSAPFGQNLTASATCRGADAMRDELL